MKVIFAVLLIIASTAFAEGTPHFLGLKGDDGVIRQVPGNCGPNAHTENHPEYGPICIQNDGAWVSAKANEPACLGPYKSGLLYTCLPISKKTYPPCFDNKGSNKRPDGSLYSCRFDENGVLHIE